MFRADLTGPPVPHTPVAGGRTAGLAAVLAVCTLAVCALVLSGCTGAAGGRSAATRPTPGESLPPVAAFAPGTCRSAAPDLLALAALTRRNHTARDLSAPVRSELSRRQNALVALRPVADPTVRPLLDAVVTAVGLVRIRADSHTYDPALLRDVDTTRRNLQSTCTT